MVGIEGGHHAQGEDVARLGIHHHDGAAVGMSLGHLIGEGLLRHVLDVAIDGEVHRRAGLRRGRGVGTRGNDVAARAALEGALTRRAGEVGLEGVLDATGPCTRIAGEADDVGGQISGRIDPL